jgi:hypothetical protein
MAQRDLPSVEAAESASAETSGAASASDIHEAIIYRHLLPIRLTHWVNVLSLVILLMSVLQIFNAHPALYWGNRSDAEQALLTIDSGVTDSGGHTLSYTLISWTRGRSLFG